MECPTPPDAEFPPAPNLRFAFGARIKLGAATEIGRTSEGLRRIVPIIGGTFVGPDLAGEILPFGADWQIVRPSGRMDLDARYTLRTHQGELIFISNIGSRFLTPEQAEQIYSGHPVDFAGARSHGVTKVEAGSKRLQWMNDSMFIPRGRRGPDSLVLAFFQVG